MTTTTKKKRRGLTFELILEPAEEGGWNVEVRGNGVKGVRSDGRTKGDAKRRARMALELAIGERSAAAATFVEKVDLPARVVMLLKRIHHAVDAAEKQQRELDALRARASREILDLGLSTRDAGEVLGVSHAYVAKAAKAHA